MQVARSHLPPLSLDIESARRKHLWRQQQQQLVRKANPADVQLDSDRTPEPATTNPLSPLSPEPTTGTADVPLAPSFPTSEIVLLADRYLLLEPVDSGPASSSSKGPGVRRCVDTVTEETYVCRQVCPFSSSTASLIEAHQRLRDSPLVNPISHVIRASDEEASSTASRSLYLLSPASYGDLHSYLRLKRRLREHEARALFRQAAEAVHHCHSNGVVLTDLKLRRFVFADPQRTQLRLESLEDAIVLERCDSDDGVWRKHGYPAYVTPEVLLSRGALYSGRAADLWSLGIILYTLLVGRYPFQDSGPFGLFTKIIRGHFVVPDFVSSRARCLIRNLLRRDPSQRLEAADILRHHWFTATLRQGKADQSKSKPDPSPAAPGTSSASSSSGQSKSDSADQVVPQCTRSTADQGIDEPRMSYDL